MHIGIIGTGYVGLVTGACFAEFGVYVTCIDRDEKKIKSLKKGVIPFYEPGLEELVKRNTEKERLLFSNNIKDAVDTSLAIFIAVGTPPRGDGSADLSYVKEVCREIATHMDSYKVIVTKSTVPVGTGKKIKRWIGESLKGKVDFDVASNPEFLREGSAIEDFMRPDRVVIGAESSQAVAILKDLYRPLYLIETPFVITNIETAELIKYASNSFLATKISFINEIANLCDAVGADVHVVAKAMGLDKRIGPKFLHPGPGYGGSCFPKDTMALLQIAREHNVDLNIVDAAVKTNQRQRALMVERIRTRLSPLKGKTVGVLGLSFKPNTNDLREAPSLYIISELLGDGAKVQAYDPVAADDARKILNSVKFKKNPYDVAKGAYALVLVTEWNEFRNLDLRRIRESMKEPNFFDLRNVYDPERMHELGFNYYSVGRNIRASKDE
ncbi:MAG TPA: UDP-glucose/GDP-mannose dehydrogenase family protein [Nitrospirae bacterium]|nr:UDP-glucose/GDP-mannose dehydrogenase family protein [Nitrospirota bacterium]